LNDLFNRLPTPGVRQLATLEGKGKRDGSVDARQSKHDFEMGKEQPVEEELEKETKSDQIQRDRQ